MPGIQFERLDSDRSWKLFDDAAKRLLGIDGSTFATRWDAGEYADADDIDVMQVAMLRPSGR